MLNFARFIVQTNLSSELSRPRNPSAASQPAPSIRHPLSSRPVRVAALATRNWENNSASLSSVRLTPLSCSVSMPVAPASADMRAGRSS